MVSVESSIEARFGDWSGIEDDFGPSARGGSATVRGPRQRPGRSLLPMDLDGHRAESSASKSNGEVTSADFTGKAVVDGVSKGAKTNGKVAGFSIKLDDDLDGPYDSWLEFEETFGPPVARHYGLSHDSREKIERHVRRGPAPSPTPAVKSVINDCPATELNPAAIERSGEQIIEITHDLARLMQEASEETMH